MSITEATAQHNMPVSPPENGEKINDSLMSRLCQQIKRVGGTVYALGQVCAYSVRVSLFRSNNHTLDFSQSSLTGELPSILVKSLTRVSTPTTIFINAQQSFGLLLDNSHHTVETKGAEEQKTPRTDKAWCHYLNPRNLASAFCTPPNY